MTNYGKGWNMKDNEVIVPCWLWFGLIVLLILITIVNQLILSSANHEIRQLRSQNQLYHMQVETYQKYPKWLLNAYDNCIPDEVPSTFVKECTIFNLKSSIEFDKQIERSK